MLFVNEKSKKKIEAMRRLLGSNPKQLKKFENSLSEIHAKYLEGISKKNENLLFKFKSFLSAKITKPMRKIEEKEKEDAEKNLENLLNNLDES